MSKLIVWIEDDYDILEPTVYPLNRAGYKIVNYRTPTEAIEDLETLRNADLILLDIFLPPGTEGNDFGDYPGVTFFRKLRKELDVQVPVVVFTALRREELRKELESLGAADIIHKPVLPSELKRRVEEVLTQE